MGGMSLSVLIKSLYIDVLCSSTWRFRSNPTISFSISQVSTTPQLALLHSIAVCCNATPANISALHSQVPVFRKIKRRPIWHLLDDFSPVLK